MSQPPSSPSPDIARLLEEGYDLVMDGHSMTVRGIPFVNRDRKVRRGDIVVALFFREGRSVPLRHSVVFVGDRPCDEKGENLRIAWASRGGPEGLICIRPEGREYRDFHELVTTYVQVLEGPAQAIRPRISARRRTGRIEFGGDGPFEYANGAVVRDDMTGFSRRITGGSVGIVGLGGTGSYVLDLVAKTPVEHIHLFDDDVFEAHNAFRAPGAASRAEVEAGRSKVDHFADVYSRMHVGIVPHRTRIGPKNVRVLDLLDFAFLCLDDPAAKPAIFARLERNGTPFVDCGIGLQPTPEGLIGMVRTTTSTDGMRSHVHEAKRTPVLECRPRRPLCLSRAGGRAQRFERRVGCAEVEAAQKLLCQRLR